MFFDRSPRLLRLWVSWTLGRLDSVAVMGDALRWIFRGLVPKERIVVIPNGTPEPARVSVATDPDHVLFLSNLRRRKGIEEAIDAALAVQAQRPSTRFTFAGEWESRQLEEAIRARAASGNGGIVFRPSVHGTDKAELLASASVFLFPPVEPEGHPRVVIEALAAGLPIVTTDRGAIRETVEDGASGFVLPDATPDAIARCVLTLLDDPPLRQRFAARARSCYEARFTQERADRHLADWLWRLL
jgi:glycosyltransferase involved in cell wall biosynthesis